jgi:sigma-B regulation protein RsbU (phosphoserine phosphatase)
MIASCGHVQTLEIAGTPFSFYRESNYDIVSVQILPGDLLVMSSDGITDQIDASETEYGQDRLRQFLGGNQALEPKALAAAILQDVNQYGGGVPDDDQTVVVVRF